MGCGGVWLKGESGGLEFGNVCAGVGCWLIEVVVKVGGIDLVVDV